METNWEKILPPNVRDACIIMADPQYLSPADQEYRLTLLKNRDLPNDHEWLQRRGIRSLIIAPIVRQRQRPVSVPAIAPNATVG